MIIQARTKKKIDMGYTAKAVRESGSLVPLKKFMEAVERGSHASARARPGASSAERGQQESTPQAMFRMWKGA
jgi:hypothetical protein